MTHVFFWDIDGTLLSTARAGVLALEDAVRETCGAQVYLADLPTSGLTDHQVAVAALEAAGCTADPRTVADFVAVYERRLPERLHAREGRELPGARELLVALGQRSDALSLLLTGNTELGARAKLRHYGLDDLISDGAYSTDQGERTEIAHRALDRATVRLGRAPRSEETYVIGDTPHDVACGEAIGARTIAVASGTYSCDQLAAHDPWWLLDELPPFELLAERLELSPTY